MPSGLTGPTGATGMDVCLEGPVGTRPLPVSGGATGTAPPNGWLGGNGAYYEWRNRVVRFEKTQGEDGFVPRGRMGFGVAITRLDDAGNDVPRVRLSTSAVGTMAAGVVFSPPANADPTYGPVARVVNDANVQGGQFVLTVTFYEQKDEERNPTH